MRVYCLAHGAPNDRFIAGNNNFAVDAIAYYSQLPWAGVGACHDNEVYFHKNAVDAKQQKKGRLEIS